jgi:hypothetical protein
MINYVEPNGEIICSFKDLDDLIENFLDNQGGHFVLELIE